MTDDQKVRLYNQFASSLNNKQKSIIKIYYQNWEADDTINLKHRFIKIFGFNTHKNQPQWIRLDRYRNKRVISNFMLGALIRSIIEEGFLPIRIFHSVAQWLDPRSVIHGNRKTRLIKSGYLIFENDDDLETSLKCARELDKILPGEKYYVYSGNISIHTWWRDFHSKSYLVDVEEDEFWLNREYYDRVARYNAFKKIQRKIKFTLDDRVTIDSRRVIPMLNTLNAITNRRVILVKNLNVGTEEIMRNAEISELSK